jgi:hypothetical protein
VERDNRKPHHPQSTSYGLSNKYPKLHQYGLWGVLRDNSDQRPLDEKKATRGWLYKVPEGTSLEPVEGNLLVGFSSILVNCDSSWNEFSCGAEQSGIPHSGEFAPFVAKKCILFGVSRLISGRKGREIAISP